MTITSKLPPFICPFERAEARRTVIKQLSDVSKAQYQVLQNLVDGLIQGTLNERLITYYNPSLIPLELDPFYPLEMAIKLGDFENTKKIFNCFERTMNCNYKKEMLECSNMEVSYRPIFWLAAVCDPEKVTKIGRPAVKPETYFEIMRFMEDKLGIGLDYQHPTYKRLISRVEYISTFCQNPEKRAFFLNHFSKAYT